MINLLRNLLTTISNGKGFWGFGVGNFDHKRIEQQNLLLFELSEVSDPKKRHRREF